MRYLGMILLLTASVLIGNAVAKSKEIRVKRLYQLERLCSEIATELRFLLPPIQQLIRTIAMRKEFEDMRFLQSAAAETDAFPVSWQSAVRQDRQCTPEEREMLYLLGNSLGTTDLEGQLAVLGQCATRFAILRQDAERNLASHTRLARSLGLFGGLFLVVMLI